MPRRAGQLAIVRSLEIDRMAARVSEALRAGAVPHLLIKGPTIATWLYADGAVRGYGDVDLLLMPQRREAGERTLDRLGFRPAGVVNPPARGIAHSEPWQRPDGSTVDVHVTLFGAAAPPERVWEALAATAGPMAVGGTVIQVPSLPARALITALHAAQHGAEPKPLADLERALEIAGDETWRGALTLAHEIEATPAMAEGLALVPGGRALVEGLGLERTARISAALTDGDGAKLMLGIERVASARGPVAKARILAREAVPTPESLRWWTPIARRGRAGLAAAYAWRLAWLAWHLPASVARWRRATR